MPTLEERVAALEAQTPRRSYTSMWSGEEIDRRLLNAAGRNLLDDWYFVNPINQRGLTEYTTPYSYTIDRWLNGVGTLTVTSQGIVVVPQNHPHQILEKYICDAMAGKQVTLSLLCADNTIYSVTVNFSSGIYVTDRDISFDIDKSIDNKFYVVFKNISSTNKVYIAAKLELGPTQTLAHKDATGNWVLNDPPPDYGLEMLKCQRYQLALKWPQFNRIVGIGYCNTVGELLVFFPTPVTLRSIPTIVMGDIRFVGVTGGMQVFTILPSMIQSVNHESNGITVTFSVPGINPGIGWLDVSSIILDANL